jgi:glycosyltransferase involved in cell wall biosynthesis
MRILHVNKFLYRRGGAEGYMLDLAALQRSRGHEVALFGMEHPENAAEPYARHFPPFVELEPPPAGVIKKASAVGRMIYSPSSRRGVERVLAEFRPDVVHLHNIYHQLSPSVVAGIRRAGVPQVMTLHDYKLACPSYQLLDHGEVCSACLVGGFRQAVIRRCKSSSLGQSALLATESWMHRVTGAYQPVAAFVCPSRFMAELMATARVFPDRMHVVNHFIDIAATPVKQRPGGPIVFAGRLSREKGVDVLIEAVALHGPDVRLEIAGDGPQRLELLRLANERAPGRVRFHGRLDRDALHELVREGAALAVPSRWYENQPMTVLEAFACGVPVLATSLGGLPELVEPGVDGMVVPPNDPRALADAIGSVLTDPAAALAMGVAARRKVADKFTPERHLARLDDVYAVAARQNPYAALAGS